MLEILILALYDAFSMILQSHEVLLLYLQPLSGSIKRIYWMAPNALTVWPG